MKNKSGFLLAEETLKIVIALISITFLVYFLTSLYFTNKESKDLELAKASLNHLVDEINQNSQEVEIYNPKGWFIGTWPHDTLKESWFGLIKTNKKGKPLSCENLGWTYCICICEENDKDACDENGICLNNEKILSIPKGSIKIDDPPLKLQIKDFQITK